MDAWSLRRGGAVGRPLRRRWDVSMTRPPTTLGSGSAAAAAAGAAVVQHRKRMTTL